jgi:3-methyladenine DNA glycosylase AlkD
VARALARKVRRTWTIREAVAFCEGMLARPQLEARVTGFLLLERFAAVFPPSLLGRTERWLRSGRCDNWALVDALCQCVLTPLLRRYPHRAPRTAAWAASPNLWLRRASLVWMVPLARHGERLEEAYAAVTRLLRDQEDLIHKACGWLLREAGRTDEARLRRFLLHHGPRLPRTTLRYAIERYEERERARLLAVTRQT